MITAPSGHLETQSPQPWHNFISMNVGSSSLIRKTAFIGHAVATWHFLHCIHFCELIMAFISISKAFSY